VGDPPRCPLGRPQPPDSTPPARKRPQWSPKVSPAEHFAMAPEGGTVALVEVVYQLAGDATRGRVRHHGAGPAEGACESKRRPTRVVGVRVAAKGKKSPKLERRYVVELSNSPR
jgi:hypothetical protein